jgi:hypothetical protein
MALITLNNRSINRSDTASSGQAWVATSATASDFQAVGGTMAPLFKANKAGDQSIPNETWTKFQFNNEVYDPSGVYDNSSNYRFTPGVAGYYFLHASCRANISADFGRLHINIRKNGSDLAKSNASNGDYITSQVSTIDLADDDDYYEVFLWHDDGSSENFGADWAWNEFSGYKLII